MFKNIGATIKTIAKVFFIVLAIASIVGGIGLLSTRYMEGFGIAVLAGGLISAFVLSAVLYGFGEMVENSDIRTELAIKADMERNQKEEKTEQE